MSWLEAWDWSFSDTGSFCFGLCPRLQTFPELFRLPKLSFVELRQVAFPNLQDQYETLIQSLWNESSRIKFSREMCARLYVCVVYLLANLIGLNLTFVTPLFITSFPFLCSLICVYCLCVQAWACSGAKQQCQKSQCLFCLPHTRL